MLSVNEKQVRKIAWGRVAFLKKLLKSNNYSNEAVIDQVEQYRVMFSKSNLDEAGMKMANKKLDVLLEEYTK
jgi:hypothetical protein